MAILLRRKKSNPNSYGGAYVSQLEYGGLRLVGEALAPLMEGPEPDGGKTGDSKRLGSVLGQWVMGQLSRTPSVVSMCYKRSDLRLMLGVMGAPLTPIQVSSTDPLPHLSIKDTPTYTAASGGLKLQNSIRNAYAMGKLKMVAFEYETATKTVKNRYSSRGVETGGFVLWQMNPDMWYVELAVGGCKVHAGKVEKMVGLPEQC
ncbi:hypothetical protein V6N13_071764 [Hibiscus sabdariffa]|uniref:Uncharacterized protein n=1 Tax=Hibiscus sabdariffa TaxID=183260 RepID=A0ABR2TCG6_9ROSI